MLPLNCDVLSTSFRPSAQMQRRWYDKEKRRAEQASDSHKFQFQPGRLLAFEEIGNKLLHCHFVGELTFV